MNVAGGIQKWRFRVYYAVDRWLTRFGMAVLGLRSRWYDFLYPELSCGACGSPQGAVHKEDCPTLGRVWAR